MDHALYGDIKTEEQKSCARPLHSALTLPPSCRVPGIAYSAAGRPSHLISAVLSDEGHARGCWSRFFLIKLPQNEEAPGREAATVPTPLAQPHPLVLAGSGERVLVVEDNAGVREYTSAALCELGYLVVAVNDGEEALRLIENGDQFDVLFTDVVLPGIDGREATQKLPKLAALYTTGYTKKRNSASRQA